MRDGWREATLGEIAHINPEKTPRWDPEHQIRYVDIASVAWGRRLNGDIPRIRFGQAPGRARRRIRWGDVVVSTVRPNLRAMAVIPEELDGEVASTGLAVVRAKEDVAIPGFIWALVSHAGFSEDMVSKATGSNYPAVRAEDVAGYRVVLPSLVEQRRIVDLIAALDDTIQATADAEAAAWALSSQVADEVAKPLLTGAAGTLSDLVTLVDCEHRTAPAASDRGFAYSVGTGNVRDGLISLVDAKPISEETFTEWTQRAVPAPGDIVLTREAPPGESGLVTAELGPIALGQRTVLLQPKPGVHGPFVWALLTSPTYRDWIRNRSVGQTVRRINVREILRIPVSAIPLAEQVAVATRLQAVVAAAVESRVVVAQAKTFRSNLLTALLSGVHEIPASYDDLLLEGVAA